MKKKNGGVNRDMDGHGSEKALKCPRCGLPMELVKSHIPREDMHFNHHMEACSEWVCHCGFAGFLGAVSGRIYPYKRVIIEKG